MRHGALPRKRTDVSVKRTTLLASYLLGLLLDPEDEDCTLMFSQYPWLQQCEQNTSKYEDAAVTDHLEATVPNWTLINKVQSYELDKVQMWAFEMTEPNAA
jgi:hypothetical protein